MELIAQHICMGKDIGIHGNLFGGAMLSWLDEAAATLAAKVCHTPNIVTIKMDEVIFKKPVKVGFQIRIYGEVLKIGNSSISLNIEAMKYNVYSGEEDLVCSTQITFVCIDETGGPIPIPKHIKDLYNK